MIHAANIIKSREFWRSQKPPLGAQIDWGNPLIKSAVSIWVCNWRKTKDELNNGNWAASGTGISMGLEGPVFINSPLSNSGSWYELTSPSTILTGAQSCFVVGKCKEYSASQNTGLLARWCGDAGGSSVNDRCFQLYQVPTTGGVGIALSSDGTYNANYDSGGSSQTTGLNRTFSAAAVFNPSISGRAFLNGIHVGSTASTPAALSSETRKWKLGHQFYALTGTNGSGNVTFRGSFYLAIIWSRALLNSEIKELHNNPYQFLYLPKARTWFVAAGANSVSNTRELLWNVRDEVGNDRDVLFNIRDEVGNDRDLAWNILASVSNQREAVWNVLQVVSNDRDVVWNIRQEVTDDREVIWNVGGSVSNARVVLWNLGGSVSNSRALIWNVRKQVGNDVEILWVTRVQVGNQVIVLWNIERRSAIVVEGVLVNECGSSGCASSWAGVRVAPGPCSEEPFDLARLLPGKFL